MNSLKKPFSHFFILLNACIITACKPEVIAPKQAPIDLSQGSYQESDFSSETELKTNQAKFLTHFETAEVQSFTGEENISIATYYLPSTAEGGEKGTVVLLPGRTEPVKKYAEVIFDLNRNGYTVFAMDHRGQGKSGRMTSNTQIGHVTQFKHYVTDLNTFLNQVVSSKKAKKRYLLAHSMGGAISALYLNSQATALFHGVALSAPMFQINTAPYGETAAWNIVSAMVNSGKGKDYAISKTDFDPKLKFTDKENDVTQSEPRFDAKMDLMQSDPELAIGGPSNQWIFESILATRKIRQTEFANAISTPILLLQAGSDKIVMTEAQTQFCAVAPRCQLEHFAGSEHEILMERDAIRNKALVLALRFFEKL